MQATIRYLADLELFKHEKPFFSNIPFYDIPGSRQHNIETVGHDNISITDIRGHENEYKLDKQGFEIRHLPTVPDEELFKNEEWIKSSYYPVIEDFVRQELSAKQIFIFDHTASADTGRILMVSPNVAGRIDYRTGAKI